MVFNSQTRWCLKFLPPLSFFNLFWNTMTIMVIAAICSMLTMYYALFKMAYINLVLTTQWDKNFNSHNYFRQNSERSEILDNLSNFYQLKEPGFKLQSVWFQRSHFLLLIFTQGYLFHWLLDRVEGKKG